MKLNRTGKIARLPRAIRQQLNHRLQEGESGPVLVAWLNSLPETQALLATDFAGKPIRTQNLSEWRNGGYRDWLLQQEALELATRLHEDAEELTAEGRPPLSDTLALWLTARYAVATRDITSTEGPEGWRLLREMCADLVKLRRGDHHAERLRLERENTELNREKSEEEMLEWARSNAQCHHLFKDALSDEERARRINEIYGLPEDYVTPGYRHPSAEPEDDEDSEEVLKDHPANETSEAETTEDTECTEAPIETDHPERDSSNHPLPSRTQAPAWARTCPGSSSFPAGTAPTAPHSQQPTP